MCRQLVWLGHPKQTLRRVHLRHLHRPRRLITQTCVETDRENDVCATRSRNVVRDIRQISIGVRRTVVTRSSRVYIYACVLFKYKRASMFSVTRFARIIYQASCGRTAVPTLPRTKHKILATTEIATVGNIWPMYHNNRSTGMSCVRVSFPVSLSLSLLVVRSKPSWARALMRLMDVLSTHGPWIANLNWYCFTKGTAARDDICFAPVNGPLFDWCPAALHLSPRRPNVPAKSARV